MALRVNTQVPLSVGEIGGSNMRSGLLIAGAIGSKLLDRGIDMRGGDVRADSVQRGELLLKGCEYDLRALVAGRGLKMMYQGEIPLLASPPRAPQRPSGNSRSCLRITLMP
jgi:hypothetical protein